MPRGTSASRAVGARVDEAGIGGRKRGAGRYPAASLKNLFKQAVMLSLSKHLYRSSNPIKRVSYAVEMLRQAQHDGLFE
ncbi:hypothetical protein BEN49_19925 [Hymenobacter coccineus]|uniref:Uncharacterized protein n=1 Tax=Hymenobacter coccineus TaxID=1908235 RepID=A0A1G1TKL3_9BACT|nr:hypothetical protein BEN49_19925 [Hymenobacter coccineus]